METAVRFENVTKIFGDVMANNNVTMDVRKGEILALLGENGSGKTTLMNMLGGIYYPDAGKIFINGTEVDIRSPKDSFALGIGMIHQHFKLVEVFSAVENVALAATLAFEMGMTTEEIASGIKKLEQIPHRLQLIESNGVYVLDDGYNCNPRGAEEAIEALTRFSGRKCIVTPGIVECGVLEEELNGKLGEKIAAAELDKIILIGDTLVGAVKSGYVAAGGDEEKLSVVKTLEAAKVALTEWIGAGDCVLFLNDLPDVY